MNFLVVRLGALGDVVHALPAAAALRAAHPDARIDWLVDAKHRPLLDLVSSADVEHFDRPGGHIGLMAGSKAREEIWPDIVEWLDDRSDR